MNEEFEYNGFWWLPEKPEKQVPGQLKFAPAMGIDLELQGNLHSPFQKDFRPSLILGLSKEGKHITLQGCQLTLESHAGTSGYDTSTLSATVAFIGTHFQSIDDIKFTTLAVHYAHLDEWFYTTGFDVQNNIRQENRVTIQYEPPQPVKAKADDYEISVVTEWRLSHSFHKQVTLAQKAWVRFVPEKTKLFENYSSPTYHMRNFLSLAMSVPTYPLFIKGITESDAPVDVFYQQDNLPPKFKTMDPRQMLFTFPAIQEQFATYLANWFSKTERLEPVYDLYFSTLYNPHQYLASAFLSLVQAIETYHRRVYGGEYLPAEKYLGSLYKKFIEVIPPELDTEFRENLKAGSLYYANQYSLRKRLKEITSELSDNLSINFISSPDSRKAFVGRICEIRNHLTHYDPNKRIEVSSNELLDLGMCQ